MSRECFRIMRPFVQGENQTIARPCSRKMRLRGEPNEEADVRGRESGDCGKSGSQESSVPLNGRTEGQLLAYFRLPFWLCLSDFFFLLSTWECGGKKRGSCIPGAKPECWLPSQPRLPHTLRGHEHNPSLVVSSHGTHLAPSAAPEMSCRPCSLR